MLRDEGHPSPRDCEDLFNLHGTLVEALETAHAGAYDCEEFGEGACILKFYGSNADRLYATIEPLLATNSMAKGGYAIKRYGDEEEDETKEIRVTW